MQASIVDLRYKMHDVLKALERNERVTILYRGIKKGVIEPVKNKSKMKQKVEDHPFFGMYSDEDIDVSKIMKELRGGRYRDI